MCGRRKMWYISVDTVDLSYFVQPLLSFFSVLILLRLLNFVLTFILPVLFPSNFFFHPVDLPYSSSFSRLFSLSYHFISFPPPLQFSAFSSPPLSDFTFLYYLFLHYCTFSSFSALHLSVHSAASFPSFHFIPTPSPLSHHFTSNPFPFLFVFVFPLIFSFLPFRFLFLSSIIIQFLYFFLSFFLVNLLNITFSFPFSWSSFFQ